MCLQDDLVALLSEADLEHAYRQAGISFKVSSYVLLEMRNQVIIVLHKCQKQPLVRVQLPDSFLRSAAVRAIGLCVISRLLCRCAQK